MNSLPVWADKFTSSAILPCQLHRPNPQEIKEVGNTYSRNNKLLLREIIYILQFRFRPALLAPLCVLND